ncbi:MAG TPA: PaaI family thioesterase [Polyangiales bacterium]|nr:PaaI family thioesterase [Polyangiales bacterium]
MNIAEMTGLELIQALVAGTLPPPSIMETMSMRFGEVKKGCVRFLARADQRHLNPMGGVHGGFAATVLDSVTGCAVHTMLDPGFGYGTVDLNIKMLRPVPRDVELVADSNVLHLSRTLGVSDGTLKTADGKLLAHATATCYIFRSDGAK